MATANVRNIIRLRGRLCLNPTDLTADFPHGGTALGLTRSGIFHPGVKTVLNEAEEWGGVVSKAYYAGEKPFLAAVLREFDNDALAAVFPNTSAGSVTGDRVITTSPGDDTQNRAGYDLTGKAGKLLFSPANPDRHPFILLYYAIPAIQESAELQLSMAQEVGIGVVWWAGVDASDRSVKIGRRADLAGLLA